MDLYNLHRLYEVLAIFDDLDTILLMIPLQILMTGLRWQMFAIIAIVVVLLAAGWRWQARWNVRQDWKTILGLAVVVCALTQLVHIVTARLYGPENSIHIEVLLPAFVVGMLMKHKEIDTAAERRITTGISFLFMLLVGLSMPLVTGAPADTAAATSVTGSQPMMPWGTLALHVLAVSLLSNLGKLVPLFFYRDRKISERLALSIGMFTRGEVGAGVIFIALGYSLGGPALIISVLTLVLNLILTGGGRFFEPRRQNRPAQYGEVYRTTPRPFYMQVPLLVNYHFHIRDLLTIQPFAGIYGGVGLRGRMEFDYLRDRGLFGDRGVLHRLDFGVRAGAGFVIRRIYLGISYDIGCMNQFKGGSLFSYESRTRAIEIRNNCLTVNIGYNF